MSSAPVAPINPSGAVTNTRASREKLCSWIISSASITIAITGKTAARAIFALSAFLDRAAGLDAIAVGQRVFDSA